MLKQLLQEAVECRASDVHITVGVPPVFRINGHLVKTEHPVLSVQDTASFVEEITKEEQRQRFLEQGELDFSFAIPGVSRFRVNLFRQRGSMGLAIRVVNERISTLDQLGHPEILKTLARNSRGLVLVTGPTGSGKSTTLAAMIDLINNERACHILTLEDPIEYLHKHRKSIVNQREIHADSKSFANGLRAALREDPDVILVGEMRDAETIGIAVTAAETGHLVFATLHTGDASQTIDRIIDVFPPYQQQQIRVQLSLTLQGIISQQLIPRRDGTGRVVALEILTATPAVRNLIREGKSHQILSIIQTGARNGMQSMDSSLKTLYTSGTITYEDAIIRASNPETFVKLTQQY
ncbi:type IV pilus twitching motility protein PilT [Propionispora hippei]|uniref:Twitching motility protein PilT n=1 Tax=Propionispora hippei DSM 15287 TaxID=1123003 RepID=A0A1M6AFH7_9FIRM|nr:type IV pilus twitching motility protein PilT [Propionispora hippei]SHI35162.1 twitching motility protein PilT [Propionispora hippei DSM 15287]